MEEENSQWINIADVMSALMMIFMFLSVTFIYELQNSRETYRSDLNAALHDEFGKDLERWKAEITPENIFRFIHHRSPSSELIASLGMNNDASFHFSFY